MALESSNGTDMVMPVAPTGGGFGGNAGFGYGDNGIWWILLLFIILGGWGNGYGGYGNGGTVSIDNSVQRTADQASIMAGISGINNALSNAEVSRCNMQANLTNQITASALAAQSNQAATQMGIADLKYTVAQEACSDRASVNSALRDVIDSNNTGVQRILDQMCADKLDAKNERIQELQTQINMMNLAASQNQQTAQLLADNAAQTFALEQYLNPVPKPAYIVANPMGCNCGNNSYGCGCGV